MAENWITVYTTDQLFDAEIIKQRLENGQIKAFILSQQDSNYLFGSIQVMVERDNVIRAKNLLNQPEFE